MKKAWEFISGIGYTPELSAEEARRIKLLTRLNLIAFLVLLMYMIVELFLRIWFFFPGLLLMQTCVVIDLCQLHRGRIIFAKHFSIIIITLSICFFALFTGPGTYNESLFIPLTIAPLVIFQCRRTAFIYLLCLLAMIIIVKLVQPLLDPLVVLSDTLTRLFLLINLLSSAVVTFFLTFYFKRANADYEAQLIRMHEILSEKNKEVTDSIRYAQHIQKAILPSETAIARQFPCSFILYAPKDIVAGDFYFLEMKDGKIIFAVCDCTGHGVPGAMVSMICSNALTRAVKEFHLTDPAAILDKTRELVVGTFEKSEDEVKDGMDISLCCFDPSAKVLHWAGANNPLWIIRNNVLIEFRPDKQPVGHTDNPLPFTTHSIPVQKGDHLYAFTDGYADQFGGDKGKKFKYSQLKAMLLANVSLDIKEQLRRIKQQLDEWKGDLEQVDDILLMGVRIDDI